MKSIVTKYTDICILCGRPAECEHHLIFGRGLRNLAEQDGLKVPCCNNCHNMGKERIHISIHVPMKGTTNNLLQLP